MRMMIDDLGFAQIERVRFNLGLSKEDMSSLLGVSRQTYYNWSHGGSIKEAHRVLARLTEVANVVRDYDWSSVAATKTTSAQRKHELLALLDGEQ